MKRHQYIEQPRSVCALGGYETLLAIEGAIPILHSGRGCGIQLNMGIANANGHQRCGNIQVHDIPCTGITEKEVIFGAAEQLNEQVEYALELLDGDIYMILTGCSAELIGDNIAEVAARFKNAEKPVLYAHTGGFLGTNIDGHHKIWDAIIQQYLKKNENDRKVNKGQVNIWGIIPIHDPFWYGTYCAVADLLEEVGLKPNFVYGPEKGIKAIDKIPNAEFNLVLSPWVDVCTVERLEKEFATPFLHYPYLPIGAVETTKFLNKLCEYANLDEKLVDSVICRHEKEFYYNIGRVSVEILQTRAFPKRFLTVADSHYTVSIFQMLISEMGMLPGRQYITDHVSEECQEDIIKGMKNVDCDVKVEVTFQQDGGAIQKELMENPPQQRVFIFGSFYEKALATNLKQPFLCISAPVANRLLLKRTYFGYDGGLAFIEDFYSRFLESIQ